MLLLSLLLLLLLSLLLLGHKKAKILEAHTKANGYDEKSTLLLPLLLLLVVVAFAAAVACAIKYAIFIWYKARAKQNNNNNKMFGKYTRLRDTLKEGKTRCRHQEICRDLYNKLKYVETNL